MLLTVTTTHRPAGDLGFLLAKHPDRCQSFDLAFGQGHVFYPEVSEDRCTAALLLDLDPISLVRGRKARMAVPLGQYVNDRPYVASSFLSVAIARVLGSALGGRSRERPELAERTIPLEATVIPLPVRGGDESLLGRLFEPLGYEVEATRLPLDETFPEWGDSPYFSLGLAGSQRLQDLLSHLYVLMPVLDHDKHYWVGEGEMEKLLAHGEGWLGEHPERELIARRFLYRQHGLARKAVALMASEDGGDPDRDEGAAEEREGELERPMSLDERRRQAVVAALTESDARRVLDLGCGEGKLLRELLGDPRFVRIAGVDVSPRALERAAKRLGLDRMPPRQRDRLHLFQGSVTYRDQRFSGYDAACLVEVVEHLDPPRLRALEKVVFEHAAPETVVVTTPNREYNALFEGLGEHHLRHPDHRFEWTREEFRRWAEAVARRNGYEVRFQPVGDEHPERGAPTQMGIFRR